MIPYLSLVIQGTGLTLLLWLCCSVISLAFGLIVGTVRAAEIRTAWIAPLLDGITMILRGVPLYAQLMIAYFAVPQMIGFAPSAFITGVTTLGLCSGAYASEIIRGTFNSIDPGQWKASSVLGYTLWQQVRYILAPQVLRRALPALTNEYLMVLKSTSLLGSIGLLELTKVGTNIMYRTFNPLPICLALAVIYLFFSGIGALLCTAAERRFNAYTL